jgi:uncharacterized protein (UPF0261 family)
MPSSGAQVFAVATMDTKGHELAFVARRLREQGVLVQTVDVGTLGPPQVAPDIDRRAVSCGAWKDAGGDSDRGTAISQMAQWLTKFLRAKLEAGELAGVIGIGGSGGTALITQAMRGLKIGVPKLMVSTVASGNMAPYIDCHDISMVYSVVDVAGLNSVSTRVLANAAASMAGMVKQPTLDQGQTKPAVCMTMFGVTTPCVNMVRQELEGKGYDSLVFHATGAGGRAMENLVASGMISGVLDITTTEVADEIAGGVFPCGPDRFDKTLSSGIPLVVSLGALDMVNFGAIETVPKKYRSRKLHVHNAQVTLMRTNVEENIKIGEWIAGKLNRSTAPVTLLIPQGGLSLLDVPGGAFYDPEANQALFDSLQRNISTSDTRVIENYPYPINSPEFAEKLLAAFYRLAKIVK